METKVKQATIDIQYEDGTKKQFHFDGFNDRVLTHLSLFSGIGGLDLAAEMAGFTTVGQVEWEAYPTKILEKHWPDVPRWRDIHEFTGDDFYRATGLRTVDVISGGFPCQPFSIAGKQRGKRDDRYLWPEMLRVIREIQPTWVLGENVPNIVNLALDTVLADLESEGYEVQCFLVPACGVDAPHKRERIAILAHALDRGGTVRRDGELQDSASDGGPGSDNGRRASTAVTGERRKDEPGTSGVADGLRAEVHRRTDSNADSDRLQRRVQDPLLETEFMDCSCRERERERDERLRRSAEIVSRTHSAWEDWPDEPGIPRVDAWVSSRLERIKCLGNAVVPQQFYPFFMAMYLIETGR